MHDALVAHEELVAWQGPEPEELRSALRVFGEQFRYPLGAGKTFSISHGNYYLGHMASMGSAYGWVIRRGEQIIASITAAIRTLKNGNSAREVVYLADLKLHPEYRRARSLLRLLQAVRDWAEQRNIHEAYAIVMDGTARTPQHYSGRCGLPGFEKTALLSVLRMDTEYFKNASFQYGEELSERQCISGVCASVCDRSLRAALPAQGDSSGHRWRSVRRYSSRKKLMGIRRADAGCSFE